LLHMYVVCSMKARAGLEIRGWIWTNRPPISVFIFAITLVSIPPSCRTKYMHNLGLIRESQFLSRDRLRTLLIGSPDAETRDRSQYGLWASAMGKMFILSVDKRNIQILFQKSR
jgi:hypothetical protein